MAKKKGVQSNDANLHTVLVLDGSGSMSDIREETISSVNEYLSGIKDDVAKVTITVFRSGGKGAEITSKTFEDLSEGVSIESKDYMCGGMTPLFDAVGTAVSGIEDENALVVIVTDGAENCSREYSEKQVQDLIKEKTEAGWQFLYLGANQDAWAGGARLGVAKDRSYHFAATGQGMGDLTSSLSVDTVAYAASFTSDGGSNWDGAELKSNDAKVRGVDGAVTSTSVNDGAVLVDEGEDDDNEA